MQPTMQQTMAGNASQSLSYKVLSEFLDFSDEEQKLWWHSCAPMFAEMLQMAGYDLHDQYRFLGMWKKAVIPFLGPYHTNSRDRWLSILTRYGTPFELSLNCSHELVRYTFEPINAATGTASDPYNTHAIWESLAKLLPLQKDIDPQCLEHYKGDLTLNKDESEFLSKNGLVGGAIKTQNKLALDLKPGGQFVLKVYIYPELKSIATGRSIESLMFESVRRQSRLFPSLLKPLSVLEEYVQSRGSNSTATARLLSCDLVSAEKSRTKLYLLERMVSLEAMEDLWTLGGRRQDANAMAGLRLIRELWDLLHFPSGKLAYPEEYLPLGTRPDEQLPLMANYTLHPDEDMPEPQVYFTTFGMNDMKVTDALIEFFQRQGWDRMAETYKDSLISYYPHENHEDVNYIHAYISFSYRKQKPYLSVYLQSFETGDWPLLQMPIPVNNGKPICLEQPITPLEVDSKLASGYQVPVAEVRN
ncbi:Dimethylallyl tryptophan synthase [Penicillium macrosclerotiorum]|uniref:Dimethylallyl tryptophan synthase n=1 Tax=Penicillium macrosclerotiorum TaxID=303699 RepID=UPI0025483E93|nr:Dimethylallyl tryptophan synthase [Penicillium macrosclerotiorum]KAJ5678580.1 Dimethylallyl tryptophan synthase [Penicillium macrosclerotiorum]